MTDGGTVSNGGRYGVKLVDWAFIPLCCAARLSSSQRSIITLAFFVSFVDYPFGALVA